MMNVRPLIIVSGVKPVSMGKALKTLKKFAKSHNLDADSYNALNNSFGAFSDDTVDKLNSIIADLEESKSRWGSEADTSAQVDISGDAHSHINKSLKRKSSDVVGAVEVEAAGKKKKSKSKDKSQAAADTADFTAVLDSTPIEAEGIAKEHHSHKKSKSAKRVKKEENGTAAKDAIKLIDPSGVSNYDVPATAAAHANGTKTKKNSAKKHAESTDEAGGSAPAAPSTEKKHKKNKKKSVEHDN